MFAKALGAEVYVISHSPNKKEDALKMGAKHFIVNDKDDWAEPYAFTFDFILNTADMTHKFDLSQYFGTLKVMGKFHNVGMPDEPITLKLQDFASNGCYIGTSHIGNREEMIDMLELASKQNIKSWVETIPISEAGCKKAVEGVKENRVRYRYTLVDFDAAFGKRY
jgi:alcohol dehydrogenase (NADP+)